MPSITTGPTGHTGPTGNTGPTGPGVTLVAGFAANNILLANGTQSTINGATAGTLTFNGTTLTTSGGISAATSSTISGVTLNSGALTGVTTIAATGLIASTAGFTGPATNTINNLNIAVTGGAITNTSTTSNQIGGVTLNNTAVSGITTLGCGAITSSGALGLGVNGITSGTHIPATNNTYNLGAVTTGLWANVYATTFRGALVGNVTGNVSGSSGSCTGNAATATTATNQSGGTVSCTSFANSTASTFTGNVTGSSGSCTGNASTATTAGNLTGTPNITVGTISCGAITSSGTQSNAISLATGTTSMLTLRTTAGQSGTAPILRLAWAAYTGGVVSAIDSIQYSDINFRTQMAFLTANTGNTLTQAMFIDSNQRVGIGTNAPVSLLNVTAVNAYSNITATNQTAQLIIGTGATGTGRLCIGHYYSSGATGAGIQSSDYFSSLDHGSPLFLNPIGGNVGIGSSNASYPLDVTGTINLASPQGFNGNTSIRYSNVQTLTGYSTSATVNPIYIPNAIDVGTTAASAYSATPANIAPGNGTTNTNYTITMGHCFNRIRAVGGFLSYTVSQWYSNQTYNIHWYIPWTSYHLSISTVGMTGANSITNYAMQTSVITAVNGAGFCPAAAVMTSYGGAPSFGYYSYGIWQAGNGSTGNQVFVTTITIISPSMAMYNGVSYGVV